MRNLLIVFIKNAQLGKVKTRLAATIGDVRALEVYNSLLDHTLFITKDLSCDKVVYYSDFIPRLDEWRSSGFFQAVQSGADLGEKMLTAFSEGFSQHYASVVIIGSDCYELSSEHINIAFSKLANVPFVIGPAYDGGYYLLGMTHLCKQLFMGKAWSSDSIFQSTTNDLKALGQPFHLLETLHDIDNEADLIRSGK
ncbi:MAG: TIGR04282 family arsenosugar biosynthesis glycosyltransferase [Chryseolinea sp.]